MTKQPSALILAGHGLNCENETLHAFEQAGGQGKILHLDDLIAAPEQLRDHQILALPGGFSYGDHLGAGQALASRLKQALNEEICTFLSRDTLAIGICNGCQALVKSGLWDANQRQVSLAGNAGGSYRCEWVTVTATAASPWLTGLDQLQLPIAHGEGRFVGQDLPVALKYQGYNPNGSTQDAAALVGYGGRLLAMMPHPERALRFSQLPTWTAEREKLRRAEKAEPLHADGFALFENAIGAFA